MKRIISCLALLFFVTQLLSASLFAGGGARHWFFFPVLAYNTETSLVYGGVIIHDTAKSYEMVDGQWTNVIQHSLNNQLMYISKAKYSIGKNYYTNLSYKYTKWPTEIYQLGNDSNKESETTFTEIKNNFKIDFYRRVYAKLFLGANAEIGSSEVTKREYNDWIDWDNLLGNEGGNIIGLGSVLKLDTRDQKNYPTNGLYYRVAYRKYDNAWGSDYNFSQTEVDLKNFFSNSEMLVVATHLDAMFCEGDIPFQRLAKLGKRLRGYADRRFMDRNRLSGRAELRMTPFTYGIQKRAGFVLFAETGQVAHDVDQFDLADFKYSYGTGFRYQLTNAADRFNMRFDIAFTEEGYSISISASEEF
jgi:hypothetical protein